MGPMVRIADHAAGVPPPARATVRSAASAKPTTGASMRSAMITDDEQRFRAVDGLVDVMRRRIPAAYADVTTSKTTRPQTKDHLDFAEEVQQLRGNVGAGGRWRAWSVPVVPLWHAMRQRRNARGGKSMDDGERENADAIASKGLSWDSGAQLPGGASDWGASHTSRARAESE